MVRPGDVAPERLKDLRAHGIGMVRLLIPRLDVERAAPYLDAALAAGLKLAVNLTHVSRTDPAELALAAERAAGRGAAYVYLADSNGSLYPDDVAVRCRAVVEALAGSDVTVGFHPHDNLGLAFANTRAAIAAGAGAVDASIGGIGKGGGNLRLELIAAHLTVHGGADFRLEPLLQDRTTHAARLRMLADGTGGTLVAGLLDVGLDQARQLQEQAVQDGYDALLRNGLRIAS